MKNIKIIEDEQAIVRHDTVFGAFDYFLVTAIKKDGKYFLKQEDIDVDEWIDTIKSLKVDYSDKKVTGYCNHGHSFRDWWKSIDSRMRVPI